MRMKIKSFLVTILACVCFSFAFTSCDKEEKKVPSYTINVSEVRLSATLGEYELPEYAVVDGDDKIMPEYVVSVSSVTDPSGRKVQVSNGSFTATKVGVYKITYIAEGVDDAVLEVEFSKPEDRAVADFSVNTAGIKIYKEVVSVASDSSVKYEGETATLKITRNAGGEGYMGLYAPLVTDLSYYDYLVFRVYNPTSENVTMGICWYGDTICKAGEWTEIKIDVMDAWLMQASDGSSQIDDIWTGKDIPRNNIKGLALRLLTGLQKGESVYVSTLWAMNEPDLQMKQ